jgi:hypothetical protein
MKILGISAHYHDAAAALVVDGLPVCCVQEERLSRRKNDAAFPIHAIEWCLERAALDPADLDAVVFYERSMLEVRPNPDVGAAGVPAIVAVVPTRDQEHARREGLGPRHYLGAARRHATRSCLRIITHRTPPPRFSRRRRGAPRSSPPTASASGRR